MTGEREIGRVNFWRYILRRDREGLFVVVRRQPYVMGQGYRERFVDSAPTEEGAVEAARKHMESVQRSAERMLGERVPIFYTDK